MTDLPQTDEPIDDAPNGSIPDITVERGALGAVQAGEVVVSIGAIGAVRADRVSVELGSIGAAAAREVRLRTAGVGALAALDARLEQTVVRTVVAQRVTLGRGTLAGIVIAARADGEGRPLLDWRGGLAAGTIFALVWLVARRLR